MNAHSTLEAGRRFNRLLRAPQTDAGELTPAIKLYRDFLRSNIEEVVKHVFPLYVSQVDSSTLRRQVDGFLAHHSASAPEFHHIATEFLVFMQPTAPAALRQCLEYEWVLLKTEIDPAVVEPPSGEPLDDAVLSLNPTLTCIELDLKAAGLSGAFAIFRDARHQVRQKPLNRFDRHVLAGLETPRGYASLKAACAMADAAPLRQWLLDTIATGLVQTRQPSMASMNGSPRRPATTQGV
ncbi:putative DNA-binding domain-containing protein [Chromobacterium sp. ASV23]|uniref:HvfC/BufC family peptide modification chaperone n=1 Tax=Chromobacterium sp. ASV23 TaxID=2795110 RepID=UPI0018EB3FE3|nr:putative DNA-binding domain-containing protein [Chromobacterium sp. ASV23]